MDDVVRASALALEGAHLKGEASNVRIDVPSSINQFLNALETVTPKISGLLIVHQA